jgi:hypothetical protein
MSTPLASRGEVLDHVFAQVVANLIGVPPGRVQQPLHALRIPLADGLGHLPAVLALDPTEQPEQVALRPLPGLRAAEAVAYWPVKLSKRLRPIADGGRTGEPTLRDHTPLPSSLQRKGSLGTT